MNNCVYIGIAKSGKVELITFWFVVWLLRANWIPSWENILVMDTRVCLLEDHLRESR